MNEAQSTLASLNRIITNAAERQAHLLVLPECAYPAYLLGSITSYRAGDHMSGEAFVGWLQERAERHRLHIVSGFIEDTSQTLHNAAVLIDDRGQERGRARKRFLWHADRNWFEPGDEIRVFDSTLGRIGIMICAEARVPEILATLAADRAELIAIPTCWVNTARTPNQYENPQVTYLIEARAREFGIPFICADKSGLELGSVGYVGQSRIVRADGSLAAEADPTGEAVITAEITRQHPPELEMTDAQRAQLLSTRPAIRTNADSPKVTLAVVPTAIVQERFAANDAEAFLETLAGQGVTVLLAQTDQAEEADRLANLASAFGMNAIGRPHEQGVSSLGPMQIGCVAGQSMMSFSASRVLALDGAQVLMFFDMIDDLAILRSRAVENRIFVAGVNDPSAIIIAPDGRVLSQSTGSDLGVAIAELDLAQAADKCVAPATDVFDARHVEQYRF